MSVFLSLQGFLMNEFLDDVRNTALVLARKADQSGMRWLINEQFQLDLFHGN
jgi:hypothetical protein